MAAPEWLPFYIISDCKVIYIYIICKYITYTHTKYLQMDEWYPQNVKTGPLFKELAEIEVQRREICGIG